MARIKEYYRRLEEDNRKLQERIREIEAEQGDNGDKAEAFDYLTGRSDANE